MSRRYPGRFALQPSADSMLDPRKESLGDNLGAFVPLLDILNHDDSEEWLKLEVVDNDLLILCNHPVKEV